MQFNYQYNEIDKGNSFVININIEIYSGEFVPAIIVVELRKKHETIIQSISFFPSSLYLTLS